MSLSRIEELLEMINNKSGPTDMIPLSRTEEILKCYINGISYTGPITSRFEELLYNTLYKQPSDEQPLSRSEEILKSKIDKTTYEGAILSRVEELLLELKTEPDPVEITIGPDTILHVLNAIEAAAVSLKIDLVPAQNGTPWISDTLNTEPYLSRAAQNGNTADETIVGGTVAWNQIVDGNNNISAYNSSYITLTYDSPSNTFTCTLKDVPTGSSKSYISTIRHTFNYEANHVYIIRMNVYADKAMRVGIPYANYKETIQGGWTVLENIYKSPSAANTKLYGISSAVDYGFETDDEYKVKDFQVTDLTQMFGSTIADYVYSLEEATAGAGVAWLRSHGFIDDSYHAYNTGELISAKPTAKTVGATTYTLGGADLRGLFKLDANNNLYCDGDVYTADGTIARNYEYRAYQSGDESLTDAITDGTHTVVKLTTPTTEVSTAYTNPQKAGEAEAFVDSRSEKVPVGHSTRYSAEYAINGFEGVSVNTTEGSYADTAENGWITTSGNDSLSDGRRTQYIPVVEGDVLKINWTNKTSASRYARLAYYNTNKEFLSLGYNSTVSANKTVTITKTIPEGAYFARFAANDRCTINYVYKNLEITEIPFGRTIYGGTVDVVSGELKITWGYIASYNGETLPGVWMSSKEVYAEGTSPSLGAEVSYILSTPITATIDPTTINISEGENYVWAEEGDSTLTYMGIPVTRKRSK